MPCVNPWEPAFVRLAEHGAGLGYRVILSGEGGNDWFEAEWYEAADLIRRLRLLGLWRLWSQEHRAGKTASDAARGLLWRQGSRVLLRDTILRALKPLAETPRRRGDPQAARPRLDAERLGAAGRRPSQGTGG